ncbi:MAG: (d)CMP kinase [Solirubrobacterales bacterium]
MLSDLARADCEFVVIGSSALSLQGWEVVPTDLDLLAPAEEVAGIGEALGAPPSAGTWVEDGAARRCEYGVAGGLVDIYVSVSGGLSYRDVVDQSIEVRLGLDDLSARVGSLEHVRDMRAAVGRDSLPTSAVPPASRGNAPLVIAIDGPAGAGKSTVTRAVAKDLGFTYLDTGAMYRCVTLAVLESRVDTDDLEAIKGVAEEADIQFQGDRVLLNGRDVTEEIRQPNVTMATPHLAAYREVRAAMVRQQRQLFSEGKYATEGRDTGTVVAPDAPLKIYLTASPEERALRRSRETGEPYEQVVAALRERDRLDSGRELSALRVAEDAVVLDSTGRSVQDVVDEIGALARERGII